MGQDTVQVGAAVIGNVFGPVGGQGSAGLIFGPDGVSGYTTTGFGYSIGKNEGTGLTIQWSNAGHNSYLSREFHNTSVSAGDMVGGTVDGFYGYDPCHRLIYGGGLTFGQDAGASGFVGETYTYVSPPTSYPHAIGMLLLPGYIPPEWRPTHP